MDFRPETLAKRLHLSWLSKKIRVGEPPIEFAVPSLVAELLPEVYRAKAR